MPRTRDPAILSLLFWSAATPLVARSQAPPPGGIRVRTVTDTLVGAVGGVAVDRLGTIYVADFRETVYQIQPDGRTRVFAAGFYGASGNAIDSRGRLLQSSFAGNYVARVERTGAVSVLATGFNGPVGIAVDPDDGLVVCNCGGNTLSRVSVDGAVTPFARDSLFNCPNGITRGPDGTYYVANFSDGRVLAVTGGGAVRELALVPGGGNGHVAFARGALYVTGFRSHTIWRVALDGAVTPLAGTGQLGERDGEAGQAMFSWPNGIAVGPQGDRLYVNDFINRFPPTIEVPPVPRSTVRQITLPSFASLLTAALGAGGLDSLRAAYRAWKSAPATAAVFTELEVNALGYQLLGARQMEAAIGVFELNVESYPSSLNVYDSLGEALMQAGRRDEAIRNYQKSLELNPANDNGRAMLERLRRP